ncbi:MAG: hypothetical protein P1S60_10900, partial [Anaerolineae bacterium]|nr:hypothetical protein [Anaerolineae bacterium]
RGKAFLSALPLSSLPVDDELLRRMEILGIHSLGALAVLPRLALIRQYGAFAGLLHDMAAGRDPRPVYPEAPPLELRHSHNFEPPAANPARLYSRIEAMCTALAQTLQQQGYQAQGIRIQLDDEKQGRYTASGVIKPPAADSPQLYRRVSALLQRIDLTMAVADVTLVIYPLRPAYLAAAQLALFSAVKDQQVSQLQQVLLRLRERFGQLVIVIASLIGPPRPQKIQVTTGPDDIPLALIWPDRIMPVRRIYEHWRESRFWWAQPVRRYCYRLEDSGGQVRVIYQDRAHQNAAHQNAAHQNAAHQHTSNENAGEKVWWLDRRRIWKTP